VPALDPEERFAETVRRGEEDLAAAARGGALVPVNRSAETERRALQLKQKKAQAYALELEQIQEEMKQDLETRISEMKREMAEKMKAANAAIEPLKKMMEQLQEGVWTINLYLGGPERLHRLRDGRPAPEETPVTVRQLVLYMDEETMITDDEGLDFRDLEKFDDWLLKDPAHVEQIVPEEKGVVALTPRRRPKHHDDPWMAGAAAKEDTRTYFLIRNGEQLYRTTTDFWVGRTLVPRTDEWDRVFESTSFNYDTREEERIILKPGTREWEKAEETADAKRRHYMRVALILQGLLDRTTIFHPVRPGTSFLDPAAHDAGRVRFILDDEPALGDGSEPFKDWQRRLSERLQPGMRVIVSSHGAHAEGWYLRDGGGGWHNPRIHPSAAEDPPDGQILQVEKNGAGQLCVRYQRTEEIYMPKRWFPSKTRPGYGHYGGYAVPKTRASCVIEPGDWWILPYDEARVEDLERFLRSRRDRVEYLRMVPIIRGAIAAKRAEEAEEEPFRVMLAGVLARENGVTVEKAQEDLPDLVEWFKVANRHHRALTTKDVSAVTLITKEHARRQKLQEIDEELVGLLRRGFPDALCVARQRDGRYLVITPAEDGETVYVRESLYGARGDWKEARDWTTVETKREARWHVAWASEAWAAWPRNPDVSKFLTGPEREALRDQILEHHESRHGRRALKGSKGLGEIFAITRRPEEGVERYDAWIDGTERYASGEANWARALEHQEYGWVRHRGEVRVTEKWGGRHSWGTPPWVERPHDVLYLDRLAAERVLASEEMIDRSRADERSAQWAARALVQEIEAAWEEREWQQAEAAFVREYGDAGLWPAERKMRESQRGGPGLPEMPAAAREALEALADALVARGVATAGLTVFQAGGMAEFAQDGLEKLAGLRFPAAPEPEEDDEDEEFENAGLLEK
jgi:hypothetical protein